MTTCNKCRMVRSILMVGIMLLVVVLANLDRLAG